MEAGTAAPSERAATGSSAEEQITERQATGEE